MATRTIQVSVSATIVFCCMSSHLFGQSPDVVNFSKSYADAEEKLYKKYVYNRRVKFVEFADASGKAVASNIVVVVCGENASRVNRLADPAAGGRQELPGAMFYQTNTYALGASDQPGKYKIHKHQIGFTKGRHGEAFGFFPTTFPLMYLGATNSSMLGEVLREADSDGPKRKLVGVKAANWFGQAATELTFDTPYGIVTKIYVDPKNDYAILGSESDGTLDLKTRKKGPVKYSTRITYQPSSEGIPLAIKFEAFDIPPGSQPVSKGGIDVLEYEKYTPTADDFDLEKQFGVKPLPVPGETPPAGRRWLWLYAAAGLLAVVTAALVVIARRKRRASRSNP